MPLGSYSRFCRQRHYVPNHNCPWAIGLHVHCIRGEVAERTAPDLLLWQRRADDDRGGSRLPPSAIDQCARQNGRPAKPHQDHDCDAVGLERAERRQKHLFVVAGYDDKRRRQAPMRHGNTRQGRCGQGARHARYDINRYPRRLEGPHLLATASEDERVATFQTDNLTAAPRRSNHDGVNGLLSQGVLAGTFSDKKALRLARVSQNPVVDERVVKHQVRRAKPHNRLASQKRRIAGARADKRHMTHLRARG
ncbi:MAG: hypothetical protein A3H95_06725 [Acidobacteria bacterium RIFCSPLOWO2_02_FULL_64_15]|nr:MAG: hypothetical protein A3H95_06725 [Acidobacteria bacterium RIFCSPLOWO2_02_FULL_64_15]